MNDLNILYIIYQIAIADIFIHKKTIFKDFDLVKAPF